MGALNYRSLEYALADMKNIKEVKVKDSDLVEKRYATFWFCSFNFPIYRSNIS
jgi:hypothetical protein